MTGSTTERGGGESDPGGERADHDEAAPPADDRTVTRERGTEDDG